MPAGWCSFSNDTDEAECDLFLLMGGDAQGVSVCSGISAQKRKKRHPKSEPYGAASIFGCMRIHTPLPSLSLYVKLISITFDRR